MLPKLLAWLGPSPPFTSASFIRDAWLRFTRFPGGRRVFDRWLGQAVPYTGSIRAEVLELGPGVARVCIRDRPELRNHLGSLHAIALCNLAELTGSLALAYGLPPDARFIITELGIRYLKKARGTIVATCNTTANAAVTGGVERVTVELRAPDGALVAEATVSASVGSTGGTTATRR